VRRRSTRVAWAMLAAWSASVAALVVLSVVNGSFQREPLANTVGLLLAFAAFMGVGALIVANRPGNAIGWVFAAIALLAVTGALAEEYAGYAVRTRPGLLPGAVLAGWYTGWAWYPTVALVLVFTPLLFPDGRPPSPPWRLVAWLTGAVTALVAALAAVQPVIELDDGHVVDNPIGVAGLGDPEGSLLSVALGVLALAAVVSLVVRFRRSRGEERLQLKWFTYAGALVPLVLVGDFLPAAVGNVLFAVGITLLPVAAGIAILRYRLYEIDRLINRTLVYGLVTVLLAGVYAGLVLALGQLSGGIGTRTPSWAVAGATLAVATLFQPARRRVQAMVDRRFNRRRYDAARTVEGFSARLRDQVDLDSLSAELLDVVVHTVQPTRASLWLRPPARPARPGGP
jgi:MFS family permease